MSADEKIVLDGGPHRPAGECFSCRHARYEPQYVEMLDRTLDKMVCTAFPNGVPNDIATGKVSHTTPYPGDHGIRFEPISTAKPRT